MLRKLLVVGAFFVLVFTGLKGNTPVSAYSYETVMTREDNIEATVNIHTIGELGETTGYPSEFYLSPDRDIAFVVVDSGALSEEAMMSLKEVKYDENIRDIHGEETTIYENTAAIIEYYEDVF